MLLISHLQFMVVNSLVFVSVKQIKGFLNLVFLIFSQLFPLLALVFVCSKLSPSKIFTPLNQPCPQGNMSELHDDLKMSWQL